MILNCSCRHAFQDARYGRGKRWCNPTKNPGSYRCSVCSKVMSQ